jgi:hypothetical protein
MACGVCNLKGHNAATCAFNAPRVPLPPVRKSKRCECCGQYGYGMHRHHTRGRGDSSDYLDVCVDCHVECCHSGHYQNLAIKPRVCRVLNRDSYWRW